MRSPSVAAPPAVLHACIPGGHVSGIFAIMGANVSACTMDSVTIVCLPQNIYSIKTTKYSLIVLRDSSISSNAS